MAAFDLKAHLRGTILMTQEFVMKDLNASTPDRCCEGRGGVSRNPLEMVVECGAVNTMVAAVLRDETPERRAPEDQQAFVATFDTPEKALAFLQGTTDSLLAAIDDCDANRFDEIVDTPLGRQMSKFALAELTAMHMMYHDGQLNYIHALDGDAEMHW